MTIRRIRTFGFTLLIGGIILCGFGLSLLMRPAQYAATATIQVMLDPGDDSYNPYFIQTTLEIIKSSIVLTNVIDTLNLNEVWGKKYFGGETLKTSETLEILERRIRLATVRNSLLVAITFYSADPNEAAEIANAIAKAYGEYRIRQAKEATGAGIKVLKQQFEDEEKQISILQTNAEGLRQKLGVEESAVKSSLPEQLPYWDEKIKLDQAIAFHRRLAAKIEQTQQNLKSPLTPEVRIVDRAKPPKIPCEPNRVVGLVLTIIGLFPAVGGFLLLKSARRQTS
jgi:succinoglycan biosynthesis transport protein ExoP